MLKKTMASLIILFTILFVNGCTNSASIIKTLPFKQLGSSSPHYVWVYLCGRSKTINSEKNTNYKILDRIGKKLHISFLVVTPRNRRSYLNNDLCWPHKDKKETLYTYQEIMHSLGTKIIDGFIGFSNGGYFLNSLAQYVELNKPIITIGAPGYLNQCGKKNNIYLMIGKDDDYNYKPAKKFYTDAQAKQSPLNITLLEYDGGHEISEELLEELLASFLDANAFPVPSGYVKTSDGTTTFFMRIPNKPWIKIPFPFSRNHKVLCSQGNASPHGRTHFYTNTLYAVDLASFPQSPAGKIYAVFGGKAFVQSGCTHASSNESNINNDCSCNSGFGNNIRIVKPNGVYAFYAHLSSIYVHDGDYVQAGQCIGVEGATGRAGHRHLHFSVHKTEKPDDLSLYQTPGESIPFTWNIRYGNEQKYHMLSSMDMKADESVAIYGEKEYRHCYP